MPDLSDRLPLKITLAFVLLGLSAAAATAQSVEWLPRDVPVQTTGSRLPAVEPVVHADPADAAHLVGGVILAAPTPDGPWYCAALASFDGGASWTRTEFPDMERCIDPTVTTLPGGGALFAGLEIRSDTTGHERFRLVTFRSEDGGRTWLTPADTTLGRGWEKPMLSRQDDVLWLVARRMWLDDEGREVHGGWVGRSPDGRAFSQYDVLVPGRVALNPTGFAPDVMGRPVVTWWAFERWLNGFTGRGMLARGQAWAARGGEQDRRFGVPWLITDDCASGGPEESFPGYPVSQGRGGRIHHACVRPGLDGISASTSTDGGATWATPVRADLASGTGTPHARTPMLAVAPNGAVAVAWYDRRHDPDEACQDVYVSASVDGGVSFSDAQRVTTETSCPLTTENGRVARSWEAGGDYSSLAVGPDGVFHLLWADARSGRFSLRRAAFRVR